MSMEWYRAYHHMPHDPKLKVIAKRTSQPMANVVAVWVCLLDAASQNEPRGFVQVDAEEIAVLQDIEVDGVVAIINAFYQKNMLSAENRLTAWEKRQYTTPTERSKKSRSGKMAHATRCNTMQRGATPEDRMQRLATQNTTDTDTDSDAENRVEAETDQRKNRGRVRKDSLAQEKVNLLSEEMLTRILRVWNEQVQHKLTKGTEAVLTPQRRQLLAERWTEDFGGDIKRWEHYCEVIGESDFCLGRIEGKDWTIDLSWAIDSSEHVLKVLEGGFSGGKHPPKPPLCLVPDLQPAWETVIKAFKQKHGGPCYRSWLTPVVLTRVHQQTGGGSIATLRCPSAFARDWITQRYLADLKRWLAEATANDARITGVELTVEQRR